MFKHFTILRDTILLLPALWLFSAAYLDRDSAKGLVAVALICLLFSFSTSFLQQLINNIKSRRVVWLLWIAGIYALFSKEVHGYNNDETRVLLSLAVYASVIPDKTILWLKKNLGYLVFISCCIAFSFAIYQTFILELGRSWQINPIPYATFSSASTISCLYFLVNSKSRRYRVIYGIATILGLSSVFLSQTRGALLALSIAFLVLMILISKKNIRLMMYSILIAGAVFTIAFTTSTVVKDRVNQTFTEIYQIKNGNLNTSIGYRFQIWKAGYELSKSPSLLGIGENHLEANKKLYTEGKISSHAIYWNHYHNQYINSLIKYGAIGLIISLSYLIIPLVHFTYFKGDEHSTLSLLLFIIFAVNSITDIPFNQSLPLGFYLIMILIITTKEPQETDQEDD